MCRRTDLHGRTDLPEPSPYDRLILDRHVRYVGDPVAIVAGENEQAVDRALKVIRVKYQVLEPVLDFHTAKDHPVLVHPEEKLEVTLPGGGRIIREISVPAIPPAREMWTRCWQTVMW